jgi:hypothetical protein
MVCLGVSIDNIEQGLFSDKLSFIKHEVLQETFYKLLPIQEV